MGREGRREKEGLRAERKERGRRENTLAVFRFLRGNVVACIAGVFEGRSCHRKIKPLW